MVTEMDRASERAHRRRLLRRPARRRHPRRGGPDRPGTTGVGGSSTPSTAPPTSCTPARVGPCRSRRARRRRRGRRRGRRPRARRDVHAPGGGGGACNGQPIRCTDRPTDLATALVATGFSYEAAERGTARPTVVAGSSRGSATSAGSAPPPSTCAGWPRSGRRLLGAGPARGDLAAGGLIATEAGARVADFRGGPCRAGEVLVAAPGVYDELSAILLAAGVQELVEGRVTRAARQRPRRGSAAPPGPSLGTRRAGFPFKSWTGGHWEPLRRVRDRALARRPRLIAAVSANSGTWERARCCRARRR